MKNLSLRKALMKKYGKKAAAIYAAMENEWSPATKPKAIAKSKKDHPAWYKNASTKNAGVLMKKVIKMKKKK